MAIEVVSGYASLPQGSTQVVRPPVGEVWAISRFAHDNPNYSSVYLTDGTLTAILYARSDTGRYAGVDGANIIGPIIISNEIWLQMDNQSGTNNNAYTGVKL